MKLLILITAFAFAPIVLPGEDDEMDTICVKPIGVDYSKYAGTDKLYMVGECEGMKGNQVVIFQNRPSFDFFDDDKAYMDEQKALEQAIWSEINDDDDEPITIEGRWHQYNGRKVFLSHKILKINTRKQN